MKKAFTITIIALILGITSILIQDRFQNPETQEQATLYKKRFWCPGTKNYIYTQIIKKEESHARNYFKVWTSPTTGKITREESYKSINEPHGTWYFYNQHAQITESRTYHKSRLQEQIITRYQKGQRTHETHYVYKGNQKRLRVETRWLYRNFQETFRIQRIEYYNTGILDEFVEFAYNSLGQISKRRVFHFDRRLKSYNNYTYKSGKKIRDDIYNPLHKLEASIEFEYNESGAVTRRTVTRPHRGHKTIEKEHRYHYNKQGALIREEEHAQIAGQFQRIQTQIYEVDERNCIRCHKTYDNKGILLDSRGHCGGTSGE